MQPNPVPIRPGGEKRADELRRRFAKISRRLDRPRGWQVSRDRVVLSLLAATIASGATALLLFSLDF